MIYRLRSGREIVMIVSMGLRFHHNIPKVNKKRGQFGPFSCLLLGCCDEISTPLKQSSLSLYHSRNR